MSPEGAGAYRRDNPNAMVTLLDAGHFALETHVDEIASRSTGFWRRQSSKQVAPS
jgi:hypothetical protein